jgi:2-methylcitrate dehydratase
MQKMEVYEDPAFTADYPEANPFRLELTTHGGVRHVAEMRYGKGHPKNPMSDSEIEAKFRRLAGPFLTPGQIDASLDRLWHIEEVTELRELMGLFVV